MIATRVIDQRVDSRRALQKVVDHGDRTLGLREVRYEYDTIAVQTSNLFKKLAGLVLLRVAMDAYEVPPCGESPDKTGTNRACRSCDENTWTTFGVHDSLGYLITLTNLPVSLLK